MTYHVIYSSESTMPMQTDDLEDLLTRARRKNAALGISGALVYAEGTFLQILEGDTAPVEALMARIQKDVRHQRVTVLQRGDVPAARFSQWNMAYVGATREQVARWAGFSTGGEANEAASQGSDEIDRTTKFAQDILALLGPPPPPGPDGFHDGPIVDR